MPPSKPPPPDPPRETGTLVSRFGTLAGVGTVAAMACALPAALRVSSALGGAESTAHVWLALAAAILLPMMVAVTVLRRAQEGWRAFGGPGAAPFVYGVSIWLVLLVVGLAVVGRFLRATTHHHALAGVTFALVGLGLAVGIAALCARMVSALKAVSPPQRRALALSISALAGLALAWLALGCARASAHDPASAAQVGIVVDDLAFMLAAAFATRHALVVRRILALVGPPSAVIILAVGLPALRATPLREVVVERAPVFGAVAQVLAPRP
jgi:hypothetical protein